MWPRFFKFFFKSAPPDFKSIGPNPISKSSEFVSFSRHIIVKTILSIRCKKKKKFRVWGMWTCIIAYKRRRSFHTENRPNHEWYTLRSQFEFQQTFQGVHIRCESTLKCIHITDFMVSSDWAADSELEQNTPTIQSTCLIYGHDRKRVMHFNLTLTHPKMYLSAMLVPFPKAIRIECCSLLLWNQ